MSAADSLVERDLDAIALTALIPFAISAGPQAPVNSLTELIALAKSKSGQVDAAIPSVTGQLVMEMLKQREVPLFGVRFKGSADAMTAVLQAPVDRLTHMGRAGRERVLLRHDADTEALKLKTLFGAQR